MLLGWTETKLWTLKYGSKSIQTSLILRQRPPKPYKLLKFFISFVTTVKSRHAPTIWEKLRWKSLCFPILKRITEIMRNFSYVLIHYVQTNVNYLPLKYPQNQVQGNAVSKLETFVWILSHISRSITWFLFALKASYLVKWSISTWSLMWLCQFNVWLKFETRPVPCWISERPMMGG